MIFYIKNFSNVIICYMEYFDWKFNINNFCENEEDYYKLVSLFNENSNIEDMEYVYNYIYSLKTKLIKQNKNDDINVLNRDKYKNCVRYKIKI